MRDVYDRFQAADTEVYGVNPGDAASHQAFIDKFDFPFALLVDDGLAVAGAYDALKPDGSGINRTVVIVGKDGRVLFRAAGAPSPVELLRTIEAADDASP